MKCSSGPVVARRFAPAKAHVLLGLAMGEIVVVAVAAAHGKDLYNRLAHTQPAPSDAVFVVARTVVVQPQLRHRPLGCLQFAHH